ncbi:hypothetical protein [Stappia sp. ES.058]|uniref:hypothetical protein n=1 Tax=Stappia sp. ES.058 TaxID=1881061 RepID=UPI00087DAE5A|nr:hypothetical protein [Stappia sp. ES.058]SDT92842.1 hypothetical protein SAMN05428979_0479 [Stappia sp. ES.058]
MTGLRTLAIGLLLPFVAMSGPAAAASVQTERIQVEPRDVAPSSPLVPADDLIEANPLAEPGTAAAGATDAPQVVLPKVHYGDRDLPKPVARMRAQLLEAAHSGDMNRIRMVLEGNEMMPTLTFGEMNDPIDYLKSASGDEDGYEILAILAEVLEAGYVHADQGTSQEMYIWPYFARTPFDRLTPEQRVELFQLVTAGDMADMNLTGTWTFYRLGIGPDGTMHYFVAGD